MACARTKIGHSKNGNGKLPNQADADSVKGSDNISRLARTKMRVSQICLTEYRNKIPPNKIMQTPQATEPVGLPLKQAARDNALRPMNQDARPCSSSGAKSHLQPLTRAASAE